MDSEVLERSWEESEDFSQFEASLAKRGALDEAAWRDTAAFLFKKAQAPAEQESAETIPEAPNTQAALSRCADFDFDDAFFDSPVSHTRQMFGRGTVEGDMIRERSPGSTPNRTASVLSPLNISTSTTPPWSCRRVVAGLGSAERRPAAPVMPIPMQGENYCTLASESAKKLSVKADELELGSGRDLEKEQMQTQMRQRPSEAPELSPASFISESSDQPESRQLRAEAFPTRHFLNNSSSSGDLSAGKENLTNEVLSPPGSMTVKVNSPKVNSPTSSAQQDLLLARHKSSKGRLRQATYGGQQHIEAMYAGVASSLALAAAYDDRRVGYFPRVRKGSSVSSPQKGTSVTAMPARLGTGSTPAPLRSSTSPRQASPPRIIKVSRASQPPPQAAALTGVSGVATTSAVRSATLTPTASGSLRPGKPSAFGGLQCGGSFGAMLGGGGGGSQYQCATSISISSTSTGVLRKVVSPRF